MKTRFVITLPALFALAIALTSPGCKLLTGSNPDVGVALRTSAGGSDTTVTGPPPPAPPPLTGLWIGVADDSMATAGRTGFIHLYALNHDATVDTVSYRFTGPSGWSGFPAAGSLAVLGGGSAAAEIPVLVPAGTASGSYLFHYQCERPDGTAIQSGDLSMFVHP